MSELLDTMNYPNGAGVCAEKSFEDRSPTARQQLAEKQKLLTVQLQQVNDAIEALDANPEIERVLTLVGRTVRF